MKLLFCRDCEDIINLCPIERKCLCGNISGKYTDRTNISITGDTAVIIGIPNSSFLKAVDQAVYYDKSENFNSFVIGVNKY